MLENKAILVKKKHTRKIKKGLIEIKPLKMKVKVIGKAIDGYLIEDCDENDIVVEKGYGYYCADAVACKAVYRTVTDEDGVETRKLAIVPVEEEGESIDIFANHHIREEKSSDTSSESSNQSMEENMDNTNTNTNKPDVTTDNSKWSTTTKVVTGLAAVATIAAGAFYYFNRNNE